MIGQHIGRFEIVGELGRGGMGVVYKARDTELSRLVALKALPAERVDDPERRKRFLLEARSASALNHPHIVTVHDILHHGDTDWIVMECVEGRTVAELIGESGTEGLPVAQAVHWIADAADALAAAHEIGIVHRDLKPANLMIDRTGRIRVMDFGLAKLELPAEDPESLITPVAPLTRAGAVVGTLEYMSPEQALGEPVDARSDVFSMGAVLYEMVTARRPFQGKNIASKIHAIAYDAPEPPRRLRPGIPEDLSAVVLRALAKDPADRFPSMESMARALRDTLQALDTPTTAFPTPALERREAPVGAATTAARGPRWPLWAGALVLVALLGFVAIRNLPRSGSSPGPSPGVEEEPSPPDGSTLPQTPYAHFRQATGLLKQYWRARYVDRALELLHRAIDLDAGYAPAYAALAEANLRKYRSERDPIFLERGRAQADHALELDPSLVRARVALGQVLLAQGDAEGAEKAFREALVRDPDNAGAERGLGDLAAAAGHPDQAEQLYRQAVARAPDDPELHSVLGGALFAAGRYEEAAVQYARSTEVAPDFIYGYSNRAASLHMLGRYGEAAEQLQRAIEIRPDPDTYSNLGTLYFFQGLYPQALEAYRRAIEMGANDYLVWANLGDAYRWSPGHEADAREAYSRALQLLSEELDKTPDDPTLQSRRTLLLAKRGGEADREQAAASAERLAVASSDPSTLYRCTLSLELVGERERALAVLSKALDAGYSVAEVRQDPELTELRDDPRYHLMMVAHEGDRETANTP